MSVLWLRTAAALYSCGLLYALIYVFRKSTGLFTPALIAFAVGTVFHLVSIVELRAETGHLPLNNFYETSSFCAFLIAVLFLLAYSYYRISIFGVCLFPLVFFMTLIGATEFPVGSWSSPQVRNVWLIVHITTVLVGYAALILSAVASVYYLLQERQLKRKNVTPSSNRLPPLAILDRVITQSMNAGFVFITIGAATGVVWASIESGTAWILNPADRLLPIYLGLLFRHDCPARLRRLARTPHRLARGQRARLLHHYLGDACRLEDFLVAMKLALAGINHRTAPVEVRERLAFRSEDIPAALSGMQARGAKEALILSTCNRVEVTAALADDTPAGTLMDALVRDRDGLTLDAVRPHLYLLQETDAIRHLFRVASSLDSMIVGEPQILGQLKQAFAQARDQGTIGRVLDVVLTRAFAVAKRVRSETEIGQSAVSVSYAAVELAREIFGSLDRKTVLIIGAGQDVGRNGAPLIASRRQSDPHYEPHRRTRWANGAIVSGRDRSLRFACAAPLWGRHRYRVFGRAGIRAHDRHGAASHRSAQESADVSHRYRRSPQHRPGGQQN